MKYCQMWKNFFCFDIFWLKKERNNIRKSIGQHKMYWYTDTFSIKNVSICRYRYTLKVYDTDTVSNTKGLLEIDMKYSKSIVLCKRRISKIQDKRKFKDSKIGTVFFFKKSSRHCGKWQSFQCVQCKISYTKTPVLIISTFFMQWK